MGSVPLYVEKLFGCCFGVMLLALLSVFWFKTGGFGVMAAIVSFLYFLITYNRYRNLTVRHSYEKETDTKISNVEKRDELVRKRTGIRESRMPDANHYQVSGDGNKQILLDMAFESLAEQGELGRYIKKNIIDDD